MKIFISYSRKDTQYKNKLLHAITKLEIDGKANIWVDQRKLKVGDRFDEEIEKQIATSDIFLLLLSENFWASEYIQNHEFPAIQHRYRKDSIKIIPIVLRDAAHLMNYGEIKQHLAIPQGKAIVDFKPQSKIFTQVYESLRDLIDASSVEHSLPLLYLCRESLKTLNPYDTFEKLSFDTIYPNEDGSYHIQYTKYFSSEQTPCTYTMDLIYSEYERQLLKEYFNNVFFLPRAPLVKLKDRLLEYKSISKHEILDILTTQEHTLFPRCLRIESKKDYIVTQDSGNLQTHLTDSSTRKVLVYGSAGVGKTSTLSQLKTNEENIVILFDSFGAGTYKDIGEKRYTKEIILTQLINELSITIGITPYIKDRLIDAEEMFTHYMSIASHLFPEKKIILIIDAADNNIEAALHFKDNPFIRESWSINLPLNCYLIMSARGGARKELLQAPDYVEELELKGFDIYASTQFVRSVFPNADENICTQFHEKTNGVPRIQSYVLENTGKDYTQFVAYINGVERFSLEHIFEDMWESAIAVIEPITLDHLHDLICLSRPATLGDFAAASSISIENALKILNTLSGFRLNEENTIGFLDEDFETFLLQKISFEEKKDAHTRIADNLLSLITTHEYAAKNIAFHLDHANGLDALLEIALNDEAMIISDRIERQECLKDRVTRALRMTFEQEHYSDVAKLLFRATELAKSDDALNNILQEEYLELISIYTNPKNAIDLLTKYQSELKAFNYHCAYLIAQTDPERALEYIKLGDVWLNRYLEDEENHHNDLNPIDIAKKTASIYYIKGFVKAFNSLRGWNLWYIFKIVDEMPIKFLSDVFHHDQTILFQRMYLIHPFVQALLMVKMHQLGFTVSKRVVQKMALSLRDFVKTYPEKHKEFHENRHLHQRDDVNKIAIDFMELAALNGVGKRTLSSILRIASVKDFRSLHDPHNLRYFEDALYVMALSSQLSGKPINLESILQESIKNKKSEYERETALKRKTDLINTVLPFYELLAKVVIEKLEFEDVKETLNTLLQASVSWNYYGHEASITSARANVLSRILVLTDASHEAMKQFLKYSEKIYFKNKIASQILHHQDKRYAYELIEMDISQELEEIKPANEKLDTFLSYAKLVKDHDIERARHYFQLALEAINEFDDNAFYLYKIVASYTSSSLNHLDKKQKVEWANRHEMLAENIRDYLSDSKDQLIGSAYQTIVKLDIPTSMNIALRWDMEKILRLEDSMNTFMQTQIGQPLFSPEQIFALRYFVKNANVVQNFISLLDKLKTDRTRLINVLPLIKDFIRKHLSSDQQLGSAVDVLNWLEENKLGKHSIAMELREFCQFYKDIDGKTDSQNIGVFPNSEEITDWELFFKPYENNLPLYFDEIIDAVNYRQTDTVLMELATRLHPEERILYLERLSAPQKRLNTFEYVKTFLYCLDLWNSDLNIHRKREELLYQYIQVNYTIFLSSFYCHHCLDLFESYLPKSTIAKIVIKEVVKNPFASPYLETYARLLELSKYLLSEEEFPALVPVFLTRLENRLKIDPIKPLVQNEADEADALVAFLYQLMGHPDRRIRWKAMHTSRDLITIDPSLIGKFCEQLPYTQGFPFTDNKIFYPIASKESLLRVLNRISYDIPGELVQHLPIFSAIVSDRNFPHIIIIAIAKSIMINVVSEYPDALPESKKEEFLLANEPKSCYLKNQFHTRGWHGEQKTWRYRFDTMDTIPYWYSNLSGIFHVDMQTIIERAESWIIDQWGQSDDIRLEHITTWERDDYYLRSHRHGNLPTIEEPARHIELHVMYLVAGKLLETHAVNISRYSDGDYCDYQEFIQRYLSDQKYWPSEIRDAKPLIPMLWGKFDKEQKIEKFDALLGLGNTFLTLNASYSSSTEQYSETINISSALVSSETASALLSALQTTKDPYDFKIPDEEEEFEIDEDYFQLKGWIPSTREENKDDIKDDPFLHGMSAGIYRPSKDFLQVCKLKTNEYGTSYLNTFSEVVVVIDNWADIRQDNYLREPESSGYRINVHIDTILSYLQYKNMDLIIEVQVSTSTKEKERENKYAKKSNMYLLRKNGSIEKGEQQILENGKVLVSINHLDDSVETQKRWVCHYLTELEKMMQNGLDQNGELKDRYEYLRNKYRIAIGTIND